MDAKEALKKMGSKKVKAKGLPKRTQNLRRKAKYQRYWAKVEAEKREKLLPSGHDESPQGG